MAMTASLRGLPACNTEACGLSRAAYRHLWNTTRDRQHYPAFQQLIDAAEVTRGTPTAAVAKSERLRGAVGALGQGGVFVAAGPVWRSVAPSCANAVETCCVTRTAGPLLWTTGTTTSAEANIQTGLPVHITSMKMPSAWCRSARCRKSPAMALDWSIIWTASEGLYVPYDLPRYF